MNSRNSPVSRNPTCSAMSTALSPTRSRARAAMFMCIPQSSARVVVGELQRLQVRRAVQPVDRVVHLRQLQARAPGRACANASIAVRIIGTTMSPISWICDASTRSPGSSLRRDR